jgi:hypothetical protein
MNNGLKIKRNKNIKEEIGMVNYQNGKIYCIRSRSRPDLVYVGSTANTLSKRFGGHKASNTCSSKQIIDVGDAYIELIEEYPCENKEQLFRREGQIMRSMVCVNHNIAGRTSKEYYQDNKETFSANHKLMTILLWFDCNYIESEGTMLQAKDIWSKFNTSEYYRGLSKSGKRSMNKKALIGTLKEKPGLQWKDNHQFKVDGKQTSNRSMLFGYELR